MPTSGDLKSADSLFTTPHPLPRNSMNPCPHPHLLKIWEWLRTLYGKPWLSYVVIYHYVVWLLHYVLWFLHYLVCSQMWCGFVFMFCWLHFRYKALAPRLYSLLATSQTSFKRGLNSCSFAFLLISMWRENITKSIPKDHKLESLIPKFAAERIELKMYQSCPMTSLYVLVWLRSGIVIASVPFVLTPKKGSVYGCSCS